jgi:SAM-dependent methyltransferase
MALSKSKPPAAEGWRGWDAYAPFYDWENARTLGRRDVPFWRRLAKRATGRVLELGCGTGRISAPLIEAGVDLIGVDRSLEMLRRMPRRAVSHRSRFVRADVRELPFREGSFSMAIAPYGMLQSLTRDRDLGSTLRAVARLIRPGGTFALDLVPDVPNWREYDNRVQLRGPAGRRHLTLIESVRQDRRRRLTTFSQTYVERRGETTTRHRFDLVFRTLTVPQMSARLDRAGFVVERLFGDYEGRSWHDHADAWIIVATRR